MYSTFFKYRVQAGAALLLFATSLSNASIGDTGTTTSIAVAQTQEAVVGTPEVTDLPIVELELPGTLSSDTISTGTLMLNKAFEGASLMPLYPHVKTRSLLQYEIVEEFVARGEYDYAYDLANLIMDWRRGQGFALIAHQMVENGYGEERVSELLRQGERVASLTESWQREEIAALLALAHAALDNEEKARFLVSGMVESEVGRLESYNAANQVDREVETRLQVLEQLLLTATLDTQRNVLEGLYALHLEVYHEPEQRSMLEAKIRAVLLKIPSNLAFEGELRLAQNAAEMGDTEAVRSILDPLEAFVFNDVWEAQHQYELICKLVDTENEVGNSERALELLERARQQFIEKKESIESMYWGTCQRPLAESYRKLGKAEVSLDIIRQALLDGVVNPNIRPRSMDFVRNAIVASRLEGVGGAEAVVATADEVLKELDPLR